MAKRAGGMELRIAIGPLREESNDDVPGFAVVDELGVQTAQFGVSGRHRGQRQTSFRWQAVGATVGGSIGQKEFVESLVPESGMVVESRHQPTVLEEFKRLGGT